MGIPLEHSQYCDCICGVLLLFCSIHRFAFAVYAGVKTHCGFAGNLEHIPMVGMGNIGIRIVDFVAQKYGNGKITSL